MARSYAELIDLVRNWSNRDSEVLTNPIIADCLRYAADKAYRSLRIAPLEHTIIYDEGLAAATSSTTNRFASTTELAIPSDLIEFIQIRGIDANGRTTRMFNEKADVRTFNDYYAERYSDLAIWTRQGNCILLAPGIGQSGTNFGSTGVRQEEAIELYYYRRLPSLHARYDATAINGDLGLLTMEMPTRAMDTPEMLTEARFTVTQDSDGNDIFTSVESGGDIYYGTPVPNWLRDENERVILMGALAEVFFYLQEDDQAQKYAALFASEIQELNREDQMRNASGGNVQVNFNGRGLI